METNVPRWLSRAAAPRCPQGHCSACPSCPLCVLMVGERGGQTQGQLASGRERGQGKVAAGHNPYQPSKNPHLLLSPPPPSTPGDVMALPSLPIVPAPSAPWGPCPTSTSPLATGGPQLHPYAQLCFLLLLLPLGPCWKPRSSTLCQSCWHLTGHWDGTHC